MFDDVPKVIAVPLRDLSQKGIYFRDGCCNRPGTVLNGLINFVFWRHFFWLCFTLHWSRGLLAVMEISMSSKKDLRKVVPVSLGIRTLPNLFTILIQKDTPYPVKKSQLFTTLVNGQKQMSFQIYAGERSDVRNNRYLATLRLRHLTRTTQPRGCKVCLTMAINRNGTTLKIVACEEGTNHSKRLKLSYNIKQIKKFVIRRHETITEDDDRNYRRFAEKKKYILSYCYAMVFNFQTRSFLNLECPIYRKCCALPQLIDECEIHNEDTLDKVTENITQMGKSVAELFRFTCLPIKSD